MRVCRSSEAAQAVANAASQRLRDEKEDAELQQRDRARDAGPEKGPEQSGALAPGGVGGLGRALGSEEAGKGPACEQGSAFAGPGERKAPVAGPSHTGALAFDVENGQRLGANGVNLNAGLGGDAEKPVPVLMLGEARGEWNLEQQFSRNQQGGGLQQG